MAIGNRRKLLTMQAQLEQQGIELARMRSLTRELNPVADVRCNIEAYRRAFQDLDMQQNCSRYIWDGLPPYMYSWLIEQMIYYRGSAAGYILGGTIYLLPYAMTRGVGINGLPNAVTPITYNGAAPGNAVEYEGRGLELAVSNYGEYNENARAAILYDRIPFFSSGAPISRYALNQGLIDLQSDIMGRIENNLAASAVKLVFPCENEKQERETERQIAKNMVAGKPYILMRRDMMSDRGGEPYHTEIDLVTQELIQTWQSVNSIRCGLSGIRNGGAFEKKERVITSEKESTNIASDMIIDIGLEMRQLWLRQMRQIYPEYRDLLDPITVRLNEPTRAAQSTEAESSAEEGLE